MSGDEDPRVGREQGGEHDDGFGPGDPERAGAEPDDGAGHAGSGPDNPAADGSVLGEADLEQALRATFARRAGDVRSGPAWQPPADGAPRRPGSRRPGNRRARVRRPAPRWLLPAAAAAIVAALVVTVIAVRGANGPDGDASPGPANRTASSTSGPSTSLAPAPTPVAQQPIPAGMQAVDALGVEIFVPKSLILDPPCESNSVSRPAYGLTYGIGCTPVQMPTVYIMTATNAGDGMAPTTGRCTSTVQLDGERGCVRIRDIEEEQAAVSATVLWPQHDVAIVAEFPSAQRAQALAVVTSAHWVPVDRHGCAATRTPVVPANAASHSDGSVLPSDATSTGACWYSGGRLVASATLPSNNGAESESSGGASNSDGSGVQQRLEHPGAPGNAPGIGAAPSYSPSPDSPTCAELGRTEGVVFQSTRPDGTIAVSAAQFADCRGGQFWTNGTHTQPVDEALASAMRGLTGFLLVFGYHPQPLDPIAGGSSASDLPASSGSPNTPVASTRVTAGSADTTVTGGLTTANNAAGGAISDAPSPAVPPNEAANNTATADEPPVPAGMQAVDALGVEIFVPKDLPVDPWVCASGSRVSRPIPHLPYGAKCAPPIRPGENSGAWIFIAKTGTSDASSCATFTVTLDDETACVVVSPDGNGVSTYTASWPKHRVAVSATGADPPVAKQILRSAHPVSVDRNGCAASRSPMAVTDQSGAASPILPTGATSLSVCWYLGNRLGASALLDRAATSRVIDAVNAAPPRWPAPAARPALPECGTVAEHDGVLLEARLPDGSTARAIGNFAACNGQQTVGNGTGAVLATKDLVSTIADAAGLGHALGLDYPYVP